MEEKLEWKEKKTSLGNAIIIGVVMLVVGLVFGLFGEQWFGGFSKYLGFSNNNSNGSID